MKRKQKSPTIKRKNKKDNEEPSPPTPKENCEKLRHKIFQRFHLVIDLDATCVSTFSFDDENDKSAYENTQRIIKELKTNKNDKKSKEIAYDLERRIHIFTLNDGIEPYKMWTILRPDIFDFFEFASLYFGKITVWSAGKEDYVNEITALLFPPYMPRPELVLTWGDCMKTFIVKDSKGKRKFEKTTEDHSSGELYSFGKPLDYIKSILSSDKQHHHTHSDPRNMIIIDDRSDIASDNMGNLVQVPVFSPDPFNDEQLKNEGINSDTMFKDFTNWLMKDNVMKCADIRTIDKTSIFKKYFSSKQIETVPKLASPSHGKKKKNKI